MVQKQWWVKCSMDQGMAQNCAFGLLFFYNHKLWLKKKKPMSSKNILDEEVKCFDLGFDFQKHVSF